MGTEGPEQRTAGAKTQRRGFVSLEGGRPCRAGAAGKERSELVGLYLKGLGRVMGS